MRLLAIALGLSLLGGFGGLSVAATLLLVPVRTRIWLVPTLVSYAVGALLGVALLELLPQALVALDARRVFGTLLVGILTFFVLEKLALWRHCHADECEVHRPSTCSTAPTSTRWRMTSTTKNGLPSVCRHSWSAKARAAPSRS